MDDAGNVAITDRLKDMYVSGGFNVYPAEVEAVLRQHPGVGQVAVIGVPDTGWARWPGSGGPGRRGDRRTIEAELVEWARGRLANYKAPARGCGLVESLPVNASGKVLKGELRQQARHRSVARGPPGRHGAASPQITHTERTTERTQNAHSQREQMNREGCHARHRLHR